MDLHDPTNSTSEPTRYWSTTNIGEAMPDVLSPMCWSFWGPNMEAGARLAYYDFGLLPKSDIGVPENPNELLVAYFFGRPALNLGHASPWGAVTTCQPWHIPGPLSVGFSPVSPPTQP